jgi:hypothetical protein
VCGGHISQSPDGVSVRISGEDRERTTPPAFQLFGYAPKGVILVHTVKPPGSTLNGCYLTYELGFFRYIPTLVVIEHPGASGLDECPIKLAAQSAFACPVIRRSPAAYAGARTDPLRTLAGPDGCR